MYSMHYTVIYHITLTYCHYFVTPYSAMFTFGIVYAIYYAEYNKEAKMKTLLITLIILSLSLPLIAAASGSYSASGSLKVSIRFPVKDPATDEYASAPAELLPVVNTMSSSGNELSIREFTVEDSRGILRLSNTDAMPQVFNFSYTVISKIDGIVLSEGSEKNVSIGPEKTIRILFPVREFSNAYVISTVEFNDCIKRAGYSL